MTETEKPYLCEHDRILTTTNVHLLNMTENDIIISIFGHIQLNTFVDAAIFFFGQVQHIDVRRCQFFGHVHRFQSYSFGHLHSVIFIRSF